MEIKMKIYKTLGVEDVMDLLGIKVTRAYQLMKKLNDELKAQGYMVIPGRISTEYLYQRLALKITERSNEE